MKKSLKILTLMLALILALGMVACGSTEEAVEDDAKAAAEDVKDDAEAVAAKVEDIAAQAKKDVEEAEEITKDDIHEAVDYIDEHIGTPLSEATDEVKEKLIYYGAYLKEIGEKAGVTVEHEVVKLGDNVYKFTTNVYTKAEDEASDISKDLKADIDKGLETVKADKDKLVDDLHNLFNKAKEAIEGNN